MDRLTLPAAATTVAAILAMCPAAALADTSAVAAASDSESVAATEAAAAEPAPAGSEAVGASSVEPPAEAAGDPAPAESGTSSDVATAPAESTPAATAPAAEPDAVTAPDPTPTVPATTVPESVDDVVTSFVVIHPASPAATSDAEARHAAASPASPAAIAPVAPLLGAEVAKAPLGTVLPKVNRELRNVEAQINDLRRRIDQGEPAPALSILRLSLTLAKLAPALVALDGRLEAAGLTPGLEREVRRLQARLAGTQASVDGLMAELRRSEAYGFELGMLMAELESFSALELEFAAPRAELAPARAPNAFELPAAPPQAAPSLSRSVAGEPPPTQVAGNGPALRSPDLAGSEAPPTAPSSGSGSASPGGAFSAAGVAALTALLIGLFLSRLSAALPAAPSRRRPVMFLSPLERPG